MSREQLTIQPDNPYVLDWWNRMATVDNGRPAAIRSLVDNDDGDPYREWHRKYINDGTHETKLKSVRDMVLRIRTGKWTDPKPVLIRFGGRGDMWIQDGSHRSYIRFALSLPIVGEVDLINEAFQPIADLESIYQPHPHPLLQGKTCWRKDMSRYELIANIVGDKTVYEFGCAEGVGLAVMQAAGAKVIGACEYEEPRRILASSLAKLPIDITVKNTDKPKSDVLLALSVLHHVPSSVEDAEQWVKYCSQYDTLFLEVPKNTNGKDQGCTVDGMASVRNREEFWLSRFDKAYTNKELIIENDPHGQRNTYHYWR